jgi:hypothetical protein
VLWADLTSASNNSHIQNGYAGHPASCPKSKAEKRLKHGHSYCSIAILIPALIIIIIIIVIVIPMVILIPIVIPIVIFAPVIRYWKLLVLEFKTKT